MLSIEYLLEEAKTNGLPVVKRRAIVREYLQIMMLNSIYKHALGKSVYFMGGTALRFFHNMPRFSEDLDFDTPSLKMEEFRELVASSKKGVEKEGFSVETTSEERGNLFIAELIVKDVMKTYGIMDGRAADVMIKVEIYRPPWKPEAEQGVLSLYGYNFSATLLSRGNMLSEKCLALFERERGRDVYDTLFMTKRQFPFNEKVFHAKNISGAPKDIVLKRMNEFSQKALDALAKQVRPFLFKEDDIELVLKAPQYAERFLREY